MCCGSGIIGIILAIETAGKVFLVDVSADALRVCKKNCLRHGVYERVEVFQGDLLNPFLGKKQFSLVVSNPPYIDSFQVQNMLAPEVSGYEPHLALDGGNKGLELIRRIRRDLPLVLRTGGQLFMEIGADQGSEVTKLFLTELNGSPPFAEAAIFKDYAGRDRVLYARL